MGLLWHNTGEERQLRSLHSTIFILWLRLITDFCHDTCMYKPGNNYKRWCRPLAPNNYILPHDCVKFMFYLECQHCSQNSSNHSVYMYMYMWVYVRVCIMYTVMCTFVFCKEYTGIQYRGIQWYETIAIIICWYGMLTKPTFGGSISHVGCATP